MAVNFNRCSNGHIIPEGATNCPWCGEETRMSTSQATLILNNNQNHAKAEYTEKLSSPPDADDRTIVQYVNPNANQSSGQGRLVGYLVSYDLNQNGAAYPLYEGRSTIGRNKNNTIAINDSQLSSEHAIILFRNNKFIFEDKLSTNGSAINGEEAIGQIMLNHGDIIDMGSYSFIFVAIPNLFHTKQA